MGLNLPTPDEAGRPFLWAAGDYGSVVFDCDGVLIDSNGVKSRAFQDILRDEAAPHLDTFAEYRAARPGLSRHALFMFFFRDIAKRSDWMSRACSASRSFSEATISALASCPGISGVEEVLDHIAGWGIPCTVISAADQDDLNTILSIRGLKRHFAATRGGNRPKADHIRALLQEGTLRPPIIYFGDSLADWEASAETGARFVFVSGASEWAEGELLSSFSIRDMRDIRFT